MQLLFHFRLSVCVALILSGILLQASAQKNIPKHKFKYDRHKVLSMPEPSDIVFDTTTNHTYIVSDHGKLYECDTDGNVIRKAEAEGDDFEGVEIVGDYVYVSDETPRKVYKYTHKDLKLVAVYDIPYGGKPNHGFESITYNYTKHCFVLISEKDPVIIFELDDNFKILRQYDFSATRDISSARWWKGQMYLLSDEDACVLRCNPETYKVEEQYNFSILNAEGIAFTPGDRVRICSDNMQSLYFFNQLPADK